ncbi:MAG: hypothetical protein DWQ01_10380 [Planctomycetota bacterium]|nr:MAG: hypothetical protein DWQ01_10380 [Planctomycetota bacterium]
MTLSLSCFAVWLAPSLLGQVPADHPKPPPPALNMELELPEKVDTGTVVFHEREIRHLATFTPLPELPRSRSNRWADDPKAAHFGQFLFFDPRLSSTGEISCASCHDPAKSWGDGKALGEGIGSLTRHTPGLWNVAYQRWFFWDGRADSLWAQALGPLEHPLEMGQSRVGLAHVLFQQADLRQAYESLFGSLPAMDEENRFPPHARPVSDAPDHPHHVAWLAMAAEDQKAVNRVFSNLGKAMEAFQRRIQSRNAPFDGFVAALIQGRKEDFQLLSPSAQRGLKLFLGRGQCTLCHFGPNLSDGEFHNIGWTYRPGAGGVDWGREKALTLVEQDPFNGLGEYSDHRRRRANQKLLYLRWDEHLVGAFKTPSLRHVTETAPYMHDGRFADLDAVLDFYSELPGAPPIGHREESLQPLRLLDQERADLKAFLESLRGQALDPALEKPPSGPLPEAKS